MNIKKEMIYDAKNTITQIREPVVLIIPSIEYIISTLSCKATINIKIKNLNLPGVFKDKSSTKSFYFYSSKFIEESESPPSTSKSSSSSS